MFRTRLAADDHVTRRHNDAICMPVETHCHKILIPTAYLQQKWVVTRTPINVILPYIASPFSGGTVFTYT